MRSVPAIASTTHFTVQLGLHIISQIGRSCIGGISVEGVLNRGNDAGGGVESFEDLGQNRREQVGDRRANERPQGDKLAVRHVGDFGENHIPVLNQPIDDGPVKSLLDLTGYLGQ